LEGEAADPGFWDDPRTAQRKMQQLDRLRANVDLWTDLDARIRAALELTDLALEAQDFSLQDQLEAETAEIAASLAKEDTSNSLRTVRRAVRDCYYSSRSRRDRFSRLGGDAAAYVCPLVGDA
jgi:hypothetical protein